MRESLQIPNFLNNGKWINKQEISLEKPVLICCWSIQCHSCKYVIKQLQSLANYIQIIFVHVTLDKEKIAIQNIQQVCQQYQLTAPIYVDEDGTISRSLKTRFTPAIYLFDENKKLRFLQQGTINMRMLRDRMARLQ